MTKTLLILSLSVASLTSCATNRPSLLDQIGSVTATGSYTDDNGNTYSQGVGIVLRNPPPRPTPGDK